MRPIETAGVECVDGPIRLAAGFHGSDDRPDPAHAGKHLGVQPGGRSKTFGESAGGATDLRDNLRDRPLPFGERHRKIEIGPQIETFACTRGIFPLEDAVANGSCAAFPDVVKPACRPFSSLTGMLEERKTAAGKEPDTEHATLPGGIDLKVFRLRSGGHRSRTQLAASGVAALVVRITSAPGFGTKPIDPYGNRRSKVCSRL